MARSMILSITALFICAGVSLAVELSFEEVTVSPGDTLHVNLLMDSTQDIRGLQFSVLHSPAAGVTFTGVATTDRTMGWTFSTSDITNGVMIIGYSATGGTIAAGTGAIMTVSYYIDEDVSATGIMLEFDEVAVSDADNNPVTDVETEGDTVVLSASAPTASFTAAPGTGQAPLTVSFDGSGSTDSDGTIESYTWNFGDGASGSDVTASHTFTDPGEYTVTLTVTDNEGNTSDTSSRIIVFTAGEYTRGDVNRDGTTDIFDLLELLGILAGKLPD